MYIWCSCLFTIFKEDTIINRQTVDSVNQYNQVAHMYVNCNTDIAGKCAVQYAYGYLGVLYKF